jgi:hypothetical protein
VRSVRGPHADDPPERVHVEGDLVEVGWVQLGQLRERAVEAAGQLQDGLLVLGETVVGQEQR